MQPAPLPADEPQRLDALRALEVLDSEAEPEFDALARAASALCGTPVALLSLVDAERQWFKSRHGLPQAAETPREVAFCAHAILGDGVFVVEDATRDARFADNPLVTGELQLRFYAGAPLRLDGGPAVGTLCVIDRRPRRLDAARLEVLAGLAQAAARALEGRRAMRKLRRLAEALAGQHRLLRTTLRSIGDGVIAADPQGLVSWLNPVAEQLLGRRAGAACGRPLSELLPSAGGGGEWFASLPDDAAVAGGRQLGDGVALQTADGRTLAVEGLVSPILGDDGERLGTVIVLRDVGAQRAATHELARRASHDALTGLVNRAGFERRLQALLDGARRGEGEHALLFIDLDRFRLVNDTCGHDAGDRLLQQVAQLLKDTVRAGDTVARLGGDEFAVLLVGCPPAVAERIAQSVCDRLDARRFVHGTQRLRVGASIGLVPVGRRSGDLAAVLRAADGCCDAAKHGGRSRVVVGAADDDARLLRQGEPRWAARIEQALDEDRFVLFGQRIVPLHAGAGGERIEVLLRLPAEDGSFVPPGQFLPAAERFHLMGCIDRWVLRRVVEGLHAQPAGPAGPLLCVNLSGQSVGDRIFHAWALELLNGAGAALRRRLAFEVTETAAVTCLDDAAAFIAEARRLGVQFALDDFGAGASSFGYLKRLPVDTLKIDGQFVRELLVQPIDEAALRCFVDVARAVGVQTVAEFVENAAVLERVRALGVDFAQGYHLHRPQPLAQLLPVPARAPRTQELPAFDSAVAR